MSRTIRKRNSRNYTAMNMILHTKPGSHGDDRKAKARQQCRGKIDWDEFGYDEQDFNPADREGW